jgi:hypothetical protein
MKAGIGLTILFMVMSDGINNEIRQATETDECLSLIAS